MSQTKNTLLLILKQEIADLQQGVIAMDEDSLIKHLAKQKLIYNITRHSNAPELTYSFIALCEYYISKELYDPAIKNLKQALEVKEAGDIYNQLGLCFYAQKKYGEAVQMFEKALRELWLEPSLEVQLTNKLEALNHLQQIYYERIQSHPNRKESLQQKLVTLSYEKIKLTKQFDESQDSGKGESYYYSLAMADLAQVYVKLGEDRQALQKINTAISLLESERDSGSRMADFYLLCAELNDKMKREEDKLEALQKGVRWMEANDSRNHLSEAEQQLYYLKIKNNLDV